MKLADEAFQKDDGFYIGPRDKGIGNRRERVMDNVKNGSLMYAPKVSLSMNLHNEPVMSFDDGRHRFAVLRDLGVETINLTFHQDSKELIPLLQHGLGEGVGDRYAEKKFGIPDENPQWERRADQSRYDPGMGEMVGYTYYENNPDSSTPVFKNPSDLKNFDNVVRAVSDEEGNIYVAQTNGNFVHRAFTKVMKSDPYDNVKNITWHRVDDSNVFGFSDSFSAYNQKKGIEKRMDVLRRKNPNLRFVPDYFFNVDPEEDEIAKQKRHEPMQYFESVIGEEILKMEGVGDKYAEKAFGIPDADNNYQSQTQPAIKDSGMGELIGHTRTGTPLGRGEANLHNPIYKNPKSLRGFEARVRAVSDKEGNLYVAQVNGDFAHGAFDMAVGAKLGDIYNIRWGLTWHRVGNSNEFALADSSSGFPSRERTDGGEYFDNNMEAVKQRNQAFEFIPNIYYDVDKGIGNQIRNAKTFEEGVGDRYAEKKWGIPNPDTSYQSQTQPAMRGDENGELVGYGLDTSYDRSEPDTRNPVFKNPSSLKNFEADVRAVSDTKGNLWVGQTNGDYLHGDMKAAIKVIPNVYYWRDAITWTREGNTNKFGLSESSNGWGGIRDRAFQQVFQANLAAVKRKHPEFEFVVNFTADLIEGVGDKYAEKQFGIPDADKQYQDMGVPDADMGEKVSPIWTTNYGGVNKYYGDIYKNPKSLRGFDADVRAIATNDGDLYVAQQNGDFIHVDIELSIEKVEGPIGEYYELHRVGTTNEFGASDTLIHKIQDYALDVRYVIEDLETRLPQFEFSDKYYLLLKNSINEIEDNCLHTPDEMPS